MDNNYPYVGESLGYSIYRNKDGFLEGYFGVGKVENPSGSTNNHKDIKRVVSNAKTIEDFAEYVYGMKKHKDYREDAEKEKQTKNFIHLINQQSTLF